MNSFTKRALTRLAFSFFLLLFLASIGIAQSVMTNSDVVEMVNSGISAEVIIAKIRSSETKFDTSTEALKKLTEAKVPDSVVVAMIDAEQKRKQSVKQESKEFAEAVDSVPEQGSLADLINATKVYVFANDLKARDIIIKELKKKKFFEVVDKLEDSDFVIKYESWKDTVNVVTGGYGNVGTVRENKETIGSFTVMMPSLNPKSNRLRLVYSTRKTEYYIWEKNPAESTTKQFLKDFEKIKKENQK
jgi:hypothetical protein